MAKRTRRCPRCIDAYLCALCERQRDYDETGTGFDAVGRLVGGAVRAARKAAGLSQAQVAARLGMPRPSIARLEKGRHRPTLDLLADVACVLGVRPSSLLASLDVACGLVQQTNEGDPTDE